MYKIIILFIASLFIYSSKAQESLPIDTAKSKTFWQKLNLDFTLKGKSIEFKMSTLPKAALNHNRFLLLSDFTEDYERVELNKSFQQYLDERVSSLKNATIEEQQDLFLTDLEQGRPGYIRQEIYDQILQQTERDRYYSIWRSNLVHVKNEEEMNQNVRQVTREMIQKGMDNLEEDLLPFITMLMMEQKLYHYDKARVVSTEPSSKGIVTSVQILNALSTEYHDVELGVCRDTHDMGLRILRNMYKEYLDAKYPDRNYNVDDYIFLQAWVTPSSQHITLVVLDPENTRDLHELDWGRVYSKKDQEGVEIGNNVGSTIRLWQFDPEKNVSRAVDLVKSQWGLFFDNEILTEDEKVGFNGIYNPDYSSKVSYWMDFSRNSKLGVSTGRLNAGQQFLMGTVRSGTHKGNITRFIEHEGAVGLQMMFVDDFERKTNTMKWADWSQSLNLFNSVRYLSDFKTTPISIKDQFYCNLFFRSQLEFFISFSKFINNDGDTDKKYTSTGDGNIWLNWGAEFMYKHPSDVLKMELRLFSRNFLIPTDVRLLSPDPFELIKHASVENSGEGFLFRTNLKFPKFEIEPEVRYEQNRFDAKFLFNSLKFSYKGKKNTCFSRLGYFDQLQGMEYYWYNKGRIWFDAGIQLTKSKTQISFSTEMVKNDIAWFGVNFSKLLN